MKADLELRLTHDGRVWIAGNGDWQAQGASLGELDSEVRRLLRDSGTFARGRRVVVFMGFDFETIPTWLRQYHTHYFNRYVSLDL